MNHVYASVSCLKCTCNLYSEDTFHLFVCLICMSDLLAHMSITLTCLVPTEARRGSSSFGTEVSDGCDLPGRFLELNPSLLDKQLVLLTIELSLKTPALNKHFGVAQDTPTKAVQIRRRGTWKALICNFSHKNFGFC